MGESNPLARVIVSLTGKLRPDCLPAPRAALLIISFNVIPRSIAGNSTLARMGLRFVRDLRLAGDEDALGAMTPSSISTHAETTGVIAWSAVRAPLGMTS